MGNGIMAGSDLQFARFPPDPTLKRLGWVSIIATTWVRKMIRGLVETRLFNQALVNHWDHCGLAAHVCRVPRSFDRDSKTFQAGPTPKRIAACKYQHGNHRGAPSTAGNRSGKSKINHCQPAVSKGRGLGETSGNWAEAGNESSAAD
jgi:hypothetical protein